MKCLAAAAGAQAVTTYQIRRLTVGQTDKQAVRQSTRLRSTLHG